MIYQTNKPKENKMNNFKAELKKLTKVTDIYFFDYTGREETENGEIVEVIRYSANIVFDNKFIIQLSGQGDEAHRAYVPNSGEQYHNDAAFQDFIADHLDFDSDEIESLLKKFDIENNYHFLNDNKTESFVV